MEKIKDISRLNPSLCNYFTSLLLYFISLLVFLSLNDKNKKEYPHLYMISFNPYLDKLSDFFQKKVINIAYSWFI